MIRRDGDVLIVTHSELPSPEDRRKYGTKFVYKLWSAEKKKSFTLSIGPRYTFIQ